MVLTLKMAMMMTMMIDDDGVDDHQVVEDQEREG